MSKKTCKEGILGNNSVMYRLKKEENDYVSGEIDRLRKMSLARFKTITEALEKEIDPVKFSEALLWANETTELNMSSEFFMKVIVFDGFAYGDISAFGVQDTSCRGTISNAISMYLLKRPWPTYGDNENMDKFQLDLEASFSKMKV